MSALRPLVRANRNRAFTLIELLVVVIVLGILMAVVLPNFFGAGDNARAASSKSDLSTAFTVAKMGEASNGGLFATGDTLATTIGQSETELHVTTGDPADAASLPPHGVLVGSDSTPTDIAIYTKASDGTIWRGTATTTSKMTFTKYTPTPVVAPLNPARLLAGTSTGFSDGRYPVDWAGNSAIVYSASDGSLMRVSASGGASTQLQPSAMMFAVSPNGQQVAYTDPANSEGLSVMPVGGGASTVICQSCWPGLQPVWSPDSSTVAATTPDGLVTVVADGSQASSPTLVVPSSSSPFPLGWGADDMIVASRNDGRIFVVSSSGSGVRDLAPGGGYNSPSVSPDGSFLTMQSDDGAWSILRSDGSGSTALTSSDYSLNGQIPFTSDSRTLIAPGYTANYTVSGTFTIGVSASGTPSTPVRVSDSLCWNPAVSPDGTKVACSIWNGSSNVVGVIALP